MGLTARLPHHLQARLERGLQLRQRGYRGRFAPSPTGPLHRGNLRTALLGWLEARRYRGVWLLRIDDLDTPRNRVGAVASILDDLDWLGLHWDGEPIVQSSRRGLYATVLSSLRQAGLLYPCRCSRRMLADVSAPHGAQGVYPGTCRLRQPNWGHQQGRLPSWRLRLEPGPLSWPEHSDLPACLDSASQVGDVVLRRADGLMAYHLATAVDEIDLGISHVLRGDDLQVSTGAQVAVMAALGAPPPCYRHLPVWRDQSGRRLSKRDAAEGLAAWRQRGAGPCEVIGALAASAGLVAKGTRITAADLLERLGPQA
ncbi:MAG: tRNA glutamyl-Q(34) synthetase GluQRS [Cyanobacteriota bacterium]|nr:tRNA glutamyl-Q(34) synthetase GluQRS [Cyanobacteriota bacterium]